MIDGMGGIAGVERREISLCSFRRAERGKRCRQIATWSRMCPNPSCPFAPFMCHGRGQSRACTRADGAAAASPGRRERDVAPAGDHGLVETMHEVKQWGAAPLPIRLGGRAWRVIGTGPVHRKARAWIEPQLAAHGIGMQARPDSVRLAGERDTRIGHHQDGEAGRRIAGRLFHSFYVRDHVERSRLFIAGGLSASGREAAGELVPTIFPTVTRLKCVPE